MALIRRAFPRPVASAALRRRVGEICARPAPRTSWRPRALRFALASGLAVAVAVPFLMGRPTGSIAYAQETPGQLALLDRQGRVIGLCPLQHTDVQADVAAYIARVTVTQRFVNAAKEPVEAVYTFPLPAESAVDDMTMILGDRRIRGEIRRREEAQAIYEAARDVGKAAALLHQERPNIFTQHVANLMPGGEIRITISYLQILPYEDGSYEFVYPMVVGPRYVPDSGGYVDLGHRGLPSPRSRVEGDPGAEAIVTDADRITPPLAAPSTRAGHDIAIVVNLCAGIPLGGIRSLLHEVDVDRTDASRATVRLSRRNELPNRDFVLRYDAAGEDLQTGLLAHAPGVDGGYFILVIQPPAAPEPEEIAPKEVVFVLDQTGSQAGWPIKKSKEAVLNCLRQLRPKDTFQVIGFNTDVYPCFARAVPVSEENLEKARRFLLPLEGEGGTDILKSLDYALKMPDDPARPRIVCYMTDGYVGNDMQILDYVRKHRGRVRMFPIGIGDAPNRFLIQGMAREGRGAAEFVTLADDAAAAAERFRRRIDQPLLLDPKVDWHGLPVEDVMPAAIPDLFSARPIVLTGRYTDAATGEITLSGILRGRPWSTTIPVQLPAHRQEGSGIRTLWARSMVEELQSRDWLGQQLERPDPGIRERIVNLALEYRLMTQHTSFVAIEERVSNPSRRFRREDVPAAVPHGMQPEGTEVADGTAERRPKTRVENLVPLTGPFPARDLGIPPGNSERATPTRMQPEFHHNGVTGGVTGSPGAPSSDLAPIPMATVDGDGRRVLPQSQPRSTGGVGVDSTDAAGSRRGETYTRRRFSDGGASSKSVGETPEIPVSSPPVPGGMMGGAPAAPPPPTGGLRAAVRPPSAAVPRVQGQRPAPETSAGPTAAAPAAPAPPRRPAAAQRPARPAPEPAATPARPGDRRVPPRLSPALRARLAAVAAGQPPAGGTLLVRVFLRNAPSDPRAQLRALGFMPVAVPPGATYLLGRIRPEKVEELGRVPWIALVDLAEP